MSILYISHEEQLVAGHMKQKVASYVQAMHGSVRYVANTDMYSCELEKQDTHKQQEREEAPWVVLLRKDSLCSLPHQVVISLLAFVQVLSERLCDRVLIIVQT